MINFKMHMVAKGLNIQAGLQNAIEYEPQWCFLRLTLYSSFKHTHCIIDPHLIIY